MDAGVQFAITLSQTARHTPARRPGAGLMEGRIRVCGPCQPAWTLLTAACFPSVNISHYRLWRPRPESASVQIRSWQLGFISKQPSSKRLAQKSLKWSHDVV